MTEFLSSSTRTSCRKSDGAVNRRSALFTYSGQVYSKQWVARKEILL